MFLLFRLSLKKNKKNPFIALEEKNSKNKWVKKIKGKQKISFY